jgi:hypothetical protein
MALSPPRTLEEIYDQLHIYNTGPDSPIPNLINIRQYLNQPSKSISDRYNYKFFMVVDLDNQIYGGFTLILPQPRNDNRPFIELVNRNKSIIECRNNTPDEFQENYRPYVQLGNEYIYITLHNPIRPLPSICILKPQWVAGGIEIPGTKFFKLRFLRNITKYIDSSILTDPTFNPLPSQPHCHQIMTTPVYELVPMSIDDINNLPSKAAYRGGKTKRRKKNRKSRKNKH